MKNISHRRLGLKILARLIPLLVLASTGSAIEAKTFRVSSVYDVNDLSPGNGLCVAYILVSPPFVLPFCTLRAAIEESNSLPGPDIVELPYGYFTLDLPGEGEDEAATGDLDIVESVTLAGSGVAETIIDGKSLDRLLDIVEPDIDVVLRDLTLVNGEITGDIDEKLRGGGALRNRGRLTVDNVVFMGHLVSGGGGGDQGGIIFNSGSCAISRSTFESGSGYEGGAIFNAASASLSLVRSTVSGNRAVRGGGVTNHGIMQITNSTISGNGTSSTAAGGGIANAGRLGLEFSTIADNQAANGGGVSNSGVVFTRNSILAGNAGDDCSRAAQIYSNGYNLDSDGSCILNQPSDIENVDAGLRPLANRGGATRTHGLYPFSPARDKGMSVEGITVDQRGVARPKGKSADIGAFELEGFAALPMIYPLLRP